MVGRHEQQRPARQPAAFTHEPPAQTHRPRIASSVRMVGAGAPEVLEEQDEGGRKRGADSTLMEDRADVKVMAGGSWAAGVVTWAGVCVGLVLRISASAWVSSAAAWPLYEAF